MNNIHVPYTTKNSNTHFIIPSAHSDNNGVDPPYLEVSIEQALHISDQVVK
jgi:hypothetical protein